ncbi:MAG TPA: undecaprenyl-phosphate glucose phosphotransferase [Alphaproteobacteria bacterium]|nr:undecaprenyl-phosphate glucose phosphotransferase [Alphaproteobacteria bacterium]
MSGAIVSGLVGIADGLGMVAVATASTIWIAGQVGDAWRVMAVAGLLGAVLLVNLLYWAGAYRFGTLSAPGASFCRSAGACLAVTAILAAISLGAGIFGPSERRWLVAWFAGGVLLLWGIRVAVLLFIRHARTKGSLGKVVAVVGAGAIGQRLLRQLNVKSDPDLKILGVYDDRLSRLPPRCMGHPILGNVDDLVSDARSHRIDTVIVALPLSADWRLTEILNKLTVLPVDVRLCPDQFGFQLSTCGISHMGGLSFLTIADNPLHDWKWVAKEIEDRLLAALILALISPMMLAIAALIKLSSRGPVFFKQKRYGLNNELIEIFKFRTMYHHARDDNAEQLTRRNDPRVTRIGAFLRKTSLDELPQFINVLRGEMSIVGPRPHALAAKAGGLLYQDAVRYYDARHRMKPGITGWAQVNGWRGETQTIEQIQKRVEHDLYYIEHWSILLDLRIIARTVLGGFTGRYAY